MNPARSYARALYGVVNAKRRDATERKQIFKRLTEVLRSRGHLALLPRIAAEYGRLEVGAERAKRYKKITLQMERTRTLLELYRKLITVNH